MRSTLSGLVLTEEEMAILKDVRFMPLKRRICQKMEMILENLREGLFQDQSAYDPALLTAESWLTGGGKISRGENYQSYAYRVLDFPAMFDQEDIITFRTIFLWGRPFGFHLIIGGQYQRRFSDILLKKKSEIGTGFYFADHDTPWKWEREAEGWVEVQAVEPSQWKRMLNARRFIKISTFLPLEQYDQLPQKGREVWAHWMNILFSGQG